MSEALMHSIAGAVGGVVSQSITYPLLTVSSKLQTTRNEADSSQLSKLSMIQQAKALIKSEGVRGGLYGGYQTAMFGVVVSQGVFYYFYQFFTEAFVRLRKVDQAKRLSWIDNLLISAIAGVFTATFTNPIWVVNTRMQISKAKSASNATPGGPSSTPSFDSFENRKSIVDTIKDIIAESGVGGLFAGLIPSLVLVANPVIQYVLTERIKIIFNRWLKNWSPKAVNFFLGAFTKLIASFVTYPYIVMKTRLQVKQGSKESERYTGTIDAIEKTWKSEGVAGFYKGLSSKLLHSVLSAALLFVVKEEAVDALTALRQPEGKA